MRQQHVASELEVASFRRRLHAAQDEFRDLELSEPLYQELCRTPDALLSVRDFVAVRVHSVLQEQRRLTETARKDLAAARATLDDATHEQQQEIRALTHRVRVAEGRESAMRQELAVEGGSRAELQKRLTEVC